MGITNGQPVNEAYTNPAFIDRRLDDTAIGKYTLNNTDPVSGSQVTNIQREHNSAASFMGKALNSTAADLPVYVNNDVGSVGDDLRTRVDAITYKFNNTAGHKHTGAAGDAPRITASDLASVPLRGYVNQGTNLTAVSGNYTDVTFAMGGKVDGGSAIATGVVTSAPYNRVVVKNNATGTAYDNYFEDSSGNIVYGRITYAASVWTLSFYVLVANVETAYTFSAPVDMMWFYQEIYNPMVNPPTFSEFAVLPSDNTTIDVIPATQSLQGKVLLSSAAAQDVGASGSVGTANATVANADHTHRGVHSICKQGSSALYGDVTLTASNAVSLTQVGNNINIDSLGSIGFQEVPAGTVNGINATFGPLLYVPSSANSIIVFIDSIAIEKSSWSLVGNSIVFSADIPQPGQKVYVFYLTAGNPVVPPTPLGVFNLEYRALTGGEITAKQLTLAATPAVANLTVVDLVGGTAQVFNVDFTVAGATLSWSGLALDGVISAGDILRVQYFT